MGMPQLRTCEGQLTYSGCNNYRCQSYVKEWHWLWDWKGQLIWRCKVWFDSYTHAKTDSNARRVSLWNGEHVKSRERVLCDTNDGKVAEVIWLITHEREDQEHWYIKITPTKRYKVVHDTVLQSGSKHLWCTKVTKRTPSRITNIVVRAWITEFCRYSFWFVTNQPMTLPGRLTGHHAGEDTCVYTRLPVRACIMSQRRQTWTFMIRKPTVSAPNGEV